MPEFTDYAPGTPSWVDLGAPDVDASARFYGAVFGVWQAGRNRGAQLANEPGSLCWNELATRDMAASQRFYGEVFGWEAETGDYAGEQYTQFKVGGRTVAGGREMGSAFPAEV